MKTKQKTAREHFETFPEPYRSQAIENTEPQWIDSRFDSSRRALSSAFIWKNTPESQGKGYWFEFYKTLL